MDYARDVKIIIEISIEKINTERDSKIGFWLDAKAHHLCEWHFRKKSPHCIGDVDFHRKCPHIKI